MLASNNQYLFAIKQKHSSELVNEKIIKFFKYNELIKELILQYVYLKINGIPRGLFDDLEFNYQHEDQSELLKNINNIILMANKNPITEKELKEEIAAFKNQIDNEVIQEFNTTLLILEEKVYLTNLTNGELAITMPRVKGDTLEDFIKSNSNNLQVSHILEIVINIIDQIEFCLSKGLVYQDFHTGNILINDSLNIKLVDFGSMSEISDENFKYGCEMLYEEVLLYIEAYYSAEIKKHSSMLIGFYERIKDCSNIEALNKIKKEMVSKKQEITCSSSSNTKKNDQPETATLEKTYHSLVATNDEVDDKNYVTVWKNSFFHHSTNLESANAEEKELNSFSL